MADGYISQIKTPDNKVYDFRDQHLKVYTGSCTTAAGTAIKDVTTDGEFTLAKGAVIFVNFSTTNTAAVADLKLRVNSNAANDAKPIKHEYNASEANLPAAGYLRANQTYQFYYDGTNWVTDVGRDTNSTYSYMRPYENTGKGSYNSQGENPVKTGAAGWKFQLSAGKYFMYSHYYDNTAKSALTLNIGSTGAKPIYINGQPSSADNYTLPGGQYLVYYDGTNYYFRTDDKMTGNITGNAATATTATTAGAFSSGTTVELTGDTTGKSSSSTKGWSIATTTKLLSGTLESDAALVTAPGTGKIKYSYNVNRGTAGLFENSNNSNSIITLNRHSGGYESQLGFSSNGNIYYRNFTGVALNNTTSWKQLAFTDSTVARANAVAWANVESKPDTATRWPQWDEIAAGADALREGTSDWTDHTEILTSYASNNGFADTNAKGVVYRRDAICAYNYIKGKLDSVYVAKSAGVTNIAWDSTNKKITKTINGTTSDVVTAETLKAAMNITAADLDISNALHFIGITSTILADGSVTATLTPKSTGSLNKTTGFVNGDVVMDSDQLREYVWSGDAWRLLGITTSSAYTQPTSTATNTWIAQISQGTDGKITATTGSLDTSGTWSGTATKASYPEGFSSRSTNATWGSQTGATVTCWGESAGGSIDIRKNNPSSGKVSIKVDGRFYGNEGANPAMLMSDPSNTSFWGMGSPDGANNVWIRTTSQGIIPFQNGGASAGHSHLGTNTWYFADSYIQNMYGTHTGNVITSSISHRDGDNIDNGSWVTGATGTAPTATTTDGTTTYSGATIGTSILTLGNNKVGANSASGVANNSKGYLRIYGADNGYAELTYNDSMFTSTKSIYLTNPTNSGINNEIRGIMATNDYWRVAGGATASNAGYMEIATADDSNEPIYVRQYVGVFNSLKRTATLLDASGNTEFPVQVTAPKFIGDSFASSKMIILPDDGYASASGTTVGAIKITLPVSWTATMMSMKVDIYNYNNDNCITYTVGGYNNYTGGDGYWVNCSSSSIGYGDKTNLNVRFGHDGTKCCIIIGEIDTSWSYPKVQVRNVLLGHNGVSLDKWMSGWTVSWITTLPENIDVIKSNSGIIPISHGGTNANDAATARSNLGTWSLVSDSYNTFMPADSATNGWYKFNTAADNGAHGILPSNRGNAGNGHSYIGTSDWYWKYAYIDEIYGHLNGNADTATAANLTSTANAVAYYTNTTGTFGSKASANGALYATSANGALQWGTLPIAQGGTGVTSFTKNHVILSDNTNGTTGLTSRAYSDSTSAGALSNSSTNFVTERDVYFGLPTLNNAHNYTSSSTYYAPTAGGTAGHILIGAGATTAPAWYGGTVMSGSAAASWKTAFNGTTDATATNAAAVTIAGGLGISKKLHVGSTATVLNLTIGSTNEYGDAYTPIYWHEGVPTVITLTQQCAFTIKSGKSGVRLSHAAITVDSYVAEIVITSGESKLNSAISWTSADGYIELTCSSTVSGDVTGYIMISRGGEITATATDIA